MERTALVLTSCALLIGLALSTGCGSDSPGDSGANITTASAPATRPATTTRTPTPKPDSTTTPRRRPTAAPSTSPEEVQDARARWGNSGITDYRFTLTTLCFCTPKNLLVTVEGGEPVSITDLGELPVSDADRIRFSTIDAILTFVESVPSDADWFSAQFDPANGIPTEIRIDYWNDAIDDEIAYRISDFTVLQ